MSRLVSRAELSRLAGVSAPAITKACRGQLSPACVNDRVDLDAECVRAYLSAKGRLSGAALAPTSGRKPGPPELPGPTGAGAAPLGETAPPTEPGPIGDDIGGPLDITYYADLTLRELVKRFGTARSFKDWLESLKGIEAVRSARLNNEETARALISRDLVKTHVFGFIDSVFRRLLHDSPKTIVRRIYAAAKSGTPMEEAEQIVRDIIRSQLAPMKAAAEKTLRTEPS